MVKSVSSLSSLAVALLIAAASGADVPDGSWPASAGLVEYAEVHVVAAGEVFDGKMQTYQRSDITCDGQTESGGSTAVFQVKPGGTLKNVIIGKNQMEGVHCDEHDCTIENVWWEDVCEDALSIKGGDATSVSTVTGGGARYADDKVIQHNGYGTVNVDGFYAEDFGKLYRSCGTCGDRQRFVNLKNIYAVNPGVSIVTVNDNYGDEATLSNIYIKADDDGYAVCAWSQGSEDGEPLKLGDGIKDPLCQYTESDIHLNGAVPASSGSNSTASAATDVISSASASAADDEAYTETPVASDAGSETEDVDETASSAETASSESTEEYTSSAESTASSEATEEYSSSTESTASSESTEEYNSSAESTASSESTEEYSTESTASSEATEEYSSSTESTASSEATEEYSSTTESTASSESTDEYSSSTESTTSSESTDESTDESTTEETDSSEVAGEAEAEPTTDVEPTITSSSCKTRVRRH